MEINIAAALKNIGEPFDFGGELPVERQTYLGRELRFTGPIRVGGTYVFDGKLFAVSGTIEARLVSECARCGEEFEEAVACALDERFEKAPERPDERETYAYEGERITLDDAVMDNLYLNLPIASVCREDCRGLCPICGINRNTAKCDCQAADVKTPFAGLAELSNEHKEV